MVLDAAVQSNDLTMYLSGEVDFNCSKSFNRLPVIPTLKLFFIRIDANSLPMPEVAPTMINTAENTLVDSTLKHLRSRCHLTPTGSSVISTS